MIVYEASLIFSVSLRFNIDLLFGLSFMRVLSDEFEWIILEIDDLCCLLIKLIFSL